MLGIPTLDQEGLIIPLDDLCGQRGVIELIDPSDGARRLFGDCGEEKTGCRRFVQATGGIRLFCRKAMSGKFRDGLMVHRVSSPFLVDGQRAIDVKYVGVGACSLNDGVIDL